MDKNECKLVYSMSESKGWEIVKEVINDNVESLIKKLETDDFESLAEVKELQAELRAYKKIKNVVMSRKRKYLKEANNG